MDNTNPTAPKAPSQPPTGRFMDLKGPAESESTQPTPVVTEAQSDETHERAIQDEQKTIINVGDEDNQQPNPPNDVQVESQQPADVATETQSKETVPVVPSDAAQTAPTEEFPAQPAENLASEDSQPVVDHQQIDQQLQQHKSHGVPVAALVVAIIVTLALSGLVIFTFIKSKNDTKLGETSSTNGTTTIAKPQASPADVDQATSEIDTSLDSIDDAADFSATEMSDQSLGL